MERKEFIDCDEKLGDFGQFMVVEETVISQEESLEDSTNIVITWGKLKLKLTESRRSLNKEYNNRHDENKTNKKESENEKNNHCIIYEEDKLNKYIQLSDDAVKNKAMHSEIQSKNEKHYPDASFTVSNIMTKSLFSNTKNENKSKRCENTKNVDKTIRSNPLHIIDENYCIGEEVSEGWTNITINKSNNQKSSVVIQELDDCDDLQVEEKRFGEKLPIIDEIEDDEEITKNINNDNEIVIEELQDLSKHEEVTTSCVIKDGQPDQSGNKTSRAKPDERQTIHLSFQRCLDNHDESYEEYIPTHFKTDVIQSLSVEDENKSLISFCDVSSESRIMLLGEIAQELKSNNGSILNNEQCPIPNKSGQVFEEEITKTKEEIICFNREAAPGLSGTTSRQEIHLFIFLVFFIFLMIFHISSSSPQEYSCYGGNSEEKATSCALDGYVELSRL